MNGPTSAYVGRFAPSPTGNLHLGTLVTAVASYLHARQARGEWLLRIEDIDPPREVPGSADAILRSLEALELHWDRDVRRQSARLPVYLACAQDLLARGLAYYCRCSRQQLRSLSAGPRYAGTCRNSGWPPGDAALRLLVTTGEIEFPDGLRGKIRRNVALADGDFVIVRRDTLPAYHLAVVVDDSDQGVTDIVRGADLVDSTPLHICLQRVLGYATPRYWHLPLITTAEGVKLSKSSGAAAVDDRRPSATAERVLSLLGLDPPADLKNAPPRELWRWAETRWTIESLAGHAGAIVAPA